MVPVDERISKVSVQITPPSCEMPDSIDPEVTPEGYCEFTLNLVVAACK